MLSTNYVRAARSALKKEGLSNRETDIVENLADGLTNREIAERMFVCEKTVKFHLTNIFQKLGVKSRLQLYKKVEEITCAA